MQQHKNIAGLFYLYYGAFVFYQIETAYALYEWAVERDLVVQLLIINIIFLVATIGLLFKIKSDDSPFIESLCNNCKYRNNNLSNICMVCSLYTPMILMKPRNSKECPLKITKAINNLH